MEIDNEVVEAWVGWEWTRGGLRGPGGTAVILSNL